MEIVLGVDNVVFFALLSTKLPAKITNSRMIPRHWTCGHITDFASAINRMAHRFNQTIGQYLGTRYKR